MKKMSHPYSLFLCLWVTLSSLTHVHVRGDDTKRLPQELIKALLVGDLAQVKAMTTAGRYVDGRDDAQRSAIMLATLGNNLEVIQYLGEQGADLYLKDGAGQTVLDKAVRVGSVAVVKYFAQQRKMKVHGVDEQTKLLYAATANFHVEVIQYLIEEKGVLLAVKNHQKATILHEAVDNGNLKVIEYLIAVQNMEVNGKDAWDRTPLHKAASKGDVAVVDYLVNAGANVWLEDYEGMTPLKIGEKYDHPKVVAFLKKEMSIWGRVGRFFKSALGKVTVLLTVIVTAYLVYRFTFAK